MAAKSTKRAQRAVSSRRKWQIAFAVIGMMVWVGASVIASQLVVGRIMLWIMGPETLSQPMPMAVYSALSYLLAVVLVILVPPKVAAGRKIINRHDKETRGERVHGSATRKILGLDGWPTWTDIGLAPIGFIVYLLLAAAITALFSALFAGFDAAETQEIGFSLGIAGLDRVIAFLTLVVVAPIAEEIIFRGWLYGKLRVKLSEVTSETVGIIVSILLVSLLFGLVHMQWNVGVNVFALSVVLCGMREFTGTIYSGMILHMIKNGFAFYLLYVVGMG